MITRVMRRFLRECRDVLATPGVAMSPLVVAVVAGVDTHERLPLDVLSAVISAAFAELTLVLVLVLMRKIPWVRRRWGKRAGRHASRAQ
jgi:hypothetical protein